MSDHVILFPRQIVKKMIEVYKEEELLWNKNHPCYKIRMKRHEAITKLTRMVQEYDAEATRIHVLRKIDSLRACMRREYKRVVDSRRMAASTGGPVYTPSLWYYDQFSFILKDEQSESKTPEPTIETTCLETQTSESEEDEEETRSDDEAENTYEDCSPEYIIAPNTMETNQKPSTSKRQYSDDESSRAKKAKASTEVEDEYDAIGVNVAAKLRYLPPNMRIIAEKLINDVLFQAQTNGLSSSTIILTPDPFKPED